MGWNPLKFFSNIGETSFDDWLTGKASARANYEVALESARNLPSAQKEGYIKAGINPIYMAGHGFQPANVSSSGGSGGYGTLMPAASGAASLIQSISSAWKAKKEGELIDSEKRHLDMQTRKEGTGVRQATEGYIQPITHTVKDIAAPIATGLGAYQLGKTLDRVKSVKTPVGKAVLRAPWEQPKAHSALSISKYIPALGVIGGAGVPAALGTAGAAEWLHPTTKESRKATELHYSPYHWSRTRLR